MNRFLLRACGAMALTPTFAAADLRYTVSPDPEHGNIAVTLKLDKMSAKQQVRIPAWCPGFYTLLKYQDKISDVKAADADGNPLTLTHPDPRAWNIDDPSKSDATITYLVKADDVGLGFFSDHISKRGAYVSGPATFLFPVDRLTEKSFVTIKAPADWTVATAMQAGSDGVYKAKDYDEMADSPIEIGRFKTKTFTAGGVPFEAIYVSETGQYSANLDAFTARLQQVVQPALSMFGGSSFKRYTFIFHFTQAGFLGGLEHCASTVIAIPDSPNMEYDELVAHEYFHAWNVKQIRPKVLGPFDYTQPCRTGNLWFAEGVTDYYGHLDSYRCGLHSRDWLLHALGDQVRELQSMSNRLTITVEQCSNQEWENGGIGYVGDLSYYVKGLLIGFILDAQIRADSGGKKSLDDVMRLMYGKYKMPNAGYDEDGILKACSEVDGKDLTDLYKVLARSTSELPYDILRRIGMRVVAPGESYVVPGYTTDSNGVVLTASRQNSDDGLMLGDKVVGVSKQRFDYNYKTPGVGVPEYGVQLTRGNQPIALNLHYVFDTADQFMLMLDDQADAAAVARRKEWLERMNGVKQEDDHGSSGNR